MNLIGLFKGYRPLVFTSDGIILARCYRLFLANLDCTRIEYIGKIPHTRAIETARRSRFLERTLRLGARSGCGISESRYLIAERTRIWMLDIGTRTVELDHVVEMGSMPLSIAYIQGVSGFDDGACYGEYGKIDPQYPVNIRTRSGNGSWRIAYSFPKGQIEHIHAIVPDKNRGVAWILTGDFRNSCGIWVARNNFLSVLPVLVGRQEFRCCWLFFYGDRCIYATDSQLEPNSIRELVFPVSDSSAGSIGNNVRSQYLMDTSGSSIYACTVQKQLVFSTTVEPGLSTGRYIADLLDCKPGPGIKGKYSDIVIGNPESGFVTAGTWHKDNLPLRLCGFGTITFPAGINPGRYIYAYFSGLSGYDGALGVFELPALKISEKLN